MWHYNVACIMERSLLIDYWVGPFHATCFWKCFDSSTKNSQWFFLYQLQFQQFLTLYMMMTTPLSDNMRLPLKSVVLITIYSKFHMGNFDCSIDKLTIEVLIIFLQLHVFLSNSTCRTDIYCNNNADTVIGGWSHH